MFAFVVLCLLLIDSMESANTSLPQPAPTRPPLPSQATPAPLPTRPPPLPTRPMPSPPPPPAFEDLVVQFYDKKVSTHDLLLRLDMSSGRFDVRDICPSFHYSCELVCPLDTEEQERVHEKHCYCDRLCVELGDCCYDYFSRCAADNTTKSGISYFIRACVKTANSGDHGYSMIDSCPPHTTDRKLESLCIAKSSTADLFGMLPVSDFTDKTDYKNVFCARCNHAKNLTYWKFSVSCKYSHDLLRNRSLMLKLITSSCEWRFQPPSNRSSHSKRCVAVEEICPHSRLLEREPLLQDLCSFYAFPVCYNVQTKNPHCEICKGNDISAYSCRCQSPSPPVPTAPGSLPTLSSLFDFSSSSHTVKVGNRETIVKNKLCTDGFVFDPFVEKCVQMHVTIPNKGLKNGTNVNCSFIEVNVSSVTLLPNGSICIPLHKRVYSSGSYFINGSSLFLCMDLNRSYTDTEVFVSTKITPLQILTYIGCTISMVSLIFLLAIYIALPELRTLPGKNLISLSCAMLLYHIVFLLTDQTDKPHICMAVSVLLHYFLLSSFRWMGVMAFDVAKTFGAKGQAALSRPIDSRKQLIKYSIFAWTTPAVIVIISVTLDKTNAVFIGYGDVFCWISNGEALLVVLGCPVALILVFNIVALTFTLVSIWKVQKSTRRVADQSNKTSLPILYIKLSSAMGFTWILGFIVPFTQVEFLDYLFVILNSLQGFLIFLAFVANKRTINKLKAGWSLRLSHSKEPTSSQSKQTRSAKLVTSAL